MISDETLDKVLEWLSANAKPAAEARAQRLYLEGYSKHLIAKLMRESGESTAAAQEREAYASMAYLEHLQGLRAAIAADEYFRWQVTNADARVGVWRSEQSTKRTMEKVT